MPNMETLSNNMRVTQVVRDDDIDAIEWNKDNKTWVIRDKQSPVKFYNFKLNAWELAHMIDVGNDHLVSEAQVISKLKAVTRK